MIHFLTIILAVTTSYYASLDGLSGQNLFNAVSAVAGQNYHSLGYDGLYTAYLKTDVYPSDSVGRSGDIWDMYGDCEFSSTEKCGSYRNECDCYNREHSIPQSWWGGGTGNIGCDIFHVIPTDGKVNGIRSNFLYGEVSSATYTYHGNKRGSTSYSGIGTVFEPRNEYKGDLARGILGAMTKWKNNMTQGEGSKFFNNTYTPTGHYGLTSYAVQLLLKWHRQDPVSQKEINRNNGIQATQGNRNPYIDYPELVEYIWGSHAGEAVVLSALMPTFDPTYVPTNPDTPVTPPDTTVTPVVPDTTLVPIIPTGVHHGCVKFSTMYSGTGVSVASRYTLCGDSAVIVLKQASNEPKYYGDALRIYRGSDVFEISATEPLASVVFTFGEGDLTNPIMPSTGKLVGDTWTPDSNSDTQSVSFGIDGAKGHRRFAEMCVTFGLPLDSDISTGWKQNTQEETCTTLVNGKLYIIHNNKTYDIYGRRR